MSLNDHIDLSNMRLLASGTVTYLVPRNLTSISVSNIVILITILGYLETEIDYKPFQLFLEWCLKIFCKKIKVYFTKIGDVMAILVIVTMLAEFYWITRGRKGG